jgi:hypothetical protein
MESCSNPYDFVDLSDIPNQNFTLDIANKISPKWSEAIRRAHIPNQYQRFWVEWAIYVWTLTLIFATIGATKVSHMWLSG